MLSLVWLLACSDYKFVSDPDAGAVDTGGAPDRPADEVPPVSADYCGAWDPGPDYAISLDEGCLREPEVGVFDPQWEWTWDTNPDVPGYSMNMATPAVGDVTGDGLPDVVFTSYYDDDYSVAGTLSAIRGDGGATHWSLAAVTDPDTGASYLPYGSGGVALGDLEGDGAVDICFASTGAAVVCVEGADGAFKWAAGSELNAYGHPALADMDGDGLAEVIFGRQIFAADGAVLGVGAGGTGGSQYMSFAVDWDGDGQLEVVAGNTVYERDGSTVWSDGRADGYPAVGDFDGDGRPDVVRSGGGSVSVALNDGTLLWESPVPGGGGGAPTVADFDGDGLPEVGVAGYAYYTLFDTDGAQLWSNPTEDDSSSVTGSSVFDFEGDGRAEVVYADEHSLYVYDGASGAVLLQEDGHASGTLFEYPVIADVDGDGATEIILSSNDMWWDGWNGITVIGSASDAWAPAREIWNQFAYHITNIDSDGGVPAVQVENWLTWNNFRAGGTELGPSHWLPDLQDGEVQSCLDSCSLGEVQLAISLENEGLVDAAGVTVSLRAGAADGPEVAGTTIPALEAGGGTWTEVLTVEEDAWGAELFLVIDGEGRIEECDEGDNVASLGPWPCP